MSPRHDGEKIYPLLHPLFLVCTRFPPVVRMPVSCDDIEGKEKHTTKSTATRDKLRWAPRPATVATCEQHVMVPMTSGVARFAAVALWSVSDGPSTTKCKFVLTTSAATLRWMKLWRCAKQFKALCARGGG